MSQEQGLLGQGVAKMIYRSVRRRFRQVLWVPPNVPITAPAILIANHNGWHDGYLMFHLVKKLGLESLDWIEEFAAFPAFASVGGMPFPRDDASARAKTIRSTIRQLRSGHKSLVLFAEGVLHPGPGLLPFGKALSTLTKQVPGATIVPVAIRYRMGVHERPEAFLCVGKPIQSTDDIIESARDALCRTLADLDRRITEREHGRGEVTFELLAEGTKDVNERWDMRRAPGGSRWPR